MSPRYQPLGVVKTNPPIKGHELIAEGHVRRAIDPDTGYYSDPPRWIGGCRCGEQPLAIDLLTVNEVKRWHRLHKAEIRANRGGAK